VSKSHGRQNLLCYVSRLLSERLENNPTHEKIIRFRHIATNTEQLHEVMKLSMDIAAYLYRIKDRAMPSERLKLHEPSPAHPRLPRCPPQSRVLALYNITL